MELRTCVKYTVWNTRCKMYSGGMSACVLQNAKLAGTYHACEASQDTNSTDKPAHTTCKQVNSHMTR